MTKTNARFSLHFPGSDIQGETVFDREKALFSEGKEAQPLVVAETNENQLVLTAGKGPSLTVSPEEFLRKYVFINGGLEARRLQTAQMDILERLEHENGNGDSHGLNFELNQLETQMVLFEKHRRGLSQLSFDGDTALIDGVPFSIDHLVETLSDNPSQDDGGISPAKKRNMLEVFSVYVGNQIAHAYRKLNSEKRQYGGRKFKTRDGTERFLERKASLLESIRGYESVYDKIQGALDFHPSIDNKSPSDELARFLSKPSVAAGFIIGLSLLSTSFTYRLPSGQHELCNQDSQAGTANPIQANQPTFSEYKLMLEKKIALEEEQKKKHDRKQNLSQSQLDTTVTHSDAITMGPNAMAKNPRIIFRHGLIGLSYWKTGDYETCDGNTWKNEQNSFPESLFFGHKDYKPNIRGVNTSPFDGVYSASPFRKWEPPSLSTEFREMYTQPINANYDRLQKEIVDTIKSISKNPAMGDSFEEISKQLPDQLARMTPDQVNHLYQGLANEVKSRFKYPSRRQIADWVKQEYDRCPNKFDALVDTGLGVCNTVNGYLVGLYRRLGIPARLASGFRSQGSEVTENDGHAWVEAFNPHMGWVIEDATPPLPPEDQPRERESDLKNFYNNYNHVATALVEHGFEAFKDNTDSLIEMVGSWIQRGISKRGMSYSISFSPHPKHSFFDIKPEEFLSFLRDNSNLSNEGSSEIRRAKRLSALIISNLSAQWGGGRGTHGKDGDYSAIVDKIYSDLIQESPHPEEDLEILVRSHNGLCGRIANDVIDLYRSQPEKKKREVIFTLLEIFGSCSYSATPKEKVQIKNLFSLLSEPEKQLFITQTYEGTFGDGRGFEEYYRMTELLVNLADPGYVHSILVPEVISRTRQDLAVVEGEKKKMGELFAAHKEFKTREQELERNTHTLDWSTGRGNPWDIADECNRFWQEEIEPYRLVPIARSLDILAQLELVRELSGRAAGGKPGERKTAIQDIMERIYALSESPNKDYPVVWKSFFKRNIEWAIPIDVLSWYKNIRDPNMMGYLEDRLNRDKHPIQFGFDPSCSRNDREREHVTGKVRDFLAAAEQDLTQLEYINESLGRPKALREQVARYTRVTTELRKRFDLPAPKEW
ncbi:transglutaminase domain-containing protein [Candidatus Woesearchaeota archaeon]|nr:transglutaminase domain-containing protein [Candidatus Woesearchaeota archaeon]